MGSRRYVLLATGALGVLAALSLNCLGVPSPAQADGQTVMVTQTTSDLSDALSAKSSLSFANDAGTPSNPYTIDVDDQRTYQAMIGWGATFTDSSAYVAGHDITSGQESTMMTQLFSTSSGIGLDFLRQPAGATDYTHDAYYTYDDEPSGTTDPTLSNFSIAHDSTYLIPAVQKALAVNPNLKVDLTSWTAPAWMKSTFSLFGGTSDSSGNPVTEYTLQPEYYAAYASYIVKAIQAYQAAGIPIWATSAQNEPSVAQQYPGMYFTSSELNTFTDNYLAPALLAAGLQPQLLAADDVCFNSPVTSAEMTNSTTDQDTGAISLHGYCGDYADLGTAHYDDPYKSLYQTELAPNCPTRQTNVTGANSDPPGRPDLTTTNVDEFPDFLVNVPRNWGQTVTAWNTVLDQEPSDSLEPNWAKFGPYLYANDGYCTPLEAVNTASGTVTPTADYYWMGQFSKFVQPGALRIGSNSWGLQNIEDVAFLDPDGTRVVVVYNPMASEQSIKVLSGSQSFSYAVPAGAMTTFTWSGGTSGGMHDWGNSALGVDGSQPYDGGLETGTWTTSSTTAAASTSLGANAWHSIYTGGDVNLGNFTASVSAQEVAAGTDDPHPKYGVYACYADEDNYVQAWIDPTNDSFDIHAKFDDEDQDSIWPSTTLPAGFDPTAAHTIGVSKLGSSLSFSLDGVTQSSLTRSVGSYLPYCQLGLVTEDATANFTGLTVENNDLWGNSVNGDDPSNIYGGGVQTGSWTHNNPNSLDETTLDGDSWDSTFGDPGLSATDYSYSVGMAQVALGSSSPKYGMYACYYNDSNYLQGWIDSTNDQFAVHGVIGGVSTGWATTPLPSGFNPAAQNTVSVTKSGSSFSFSINGTVQASATASLSGCQVGLVTQDARAQFRSVVMP